MLCPGCDRSLIRATGYPQQLWVHQGRKPNRSHVIVECWYTQHYLTGEGKIFWLSQQVDDGSCVRGHTVRRNNALGRQ